MKYGWFYGVLTVVAVSQSVVEFGADAVWGSVEGLSDAHAHVSGATLGSVSFDLEITAVNAASTTTPLLAGPAGFGVYGGVNSLLDNRNDLDASNDEGVTFSLQNIQGLPSGASLTISGVKTLFGLNDLYELSSGAEGVIPIDGIIPVGGVTEVTLYARGVTAGVASNTSFALDQLYVTLDLGEEGEETGSTLLVDNIEIGGDGVTTLSLVTEVGQQYLLEHSADLVAWKTLETITATETETAYPWSDGTVTHPAKQFFRYSLANGALVDGQILEVEQSWEEEPDGFMRTALVHVPETGLPPYPVVFMLHGSGGNTSFINSMGGRLDSVIRIAPQGYGNQWNVDAEQNTQAPDVEFIRQLIAEVKTYANVDTSQISIMGNSNGSGMTNRLIIDLEAGTFQKAAGMVSQMIVKMYDEASGTFRSSADSTSVAYDTVKVPAPGIQILNITGTSDFAVPYLGGNGVGTVFHDSQDSIYWLAQAMGESGAQLSDADGEPGDGITRPTDIVKYAYLNGQVTHYKVIGGSHSLAPYASEAADLVADFLLNP